MNKQEFYDKCCQSLRTYGNPYGNLPTRGWGFENPEDPSQQCAIARFTTKNERLDLIAGLTQCSDIASLVMHLFDNFPDRCNDKEQLEVWLQMVAKTNDVVYTPPVLPQKAEVILELEKEEVVLP